jgi:hypothetical protein
MTRHDEPTFETEAELCAAFVAWADKDGWDAWPETCGFDLLMVNRETQHQKAREKLGKPKFEKGAET